MATPYTDKSILLSNQESEENVESSHKSEPSDHGLILVSQENENFNGDSTDADLSEGNLWENQNTEESQERNIGEESNGEMTSAATHDTVKNIDATIKDDSTKTRNIHDIGAKSRGAAMKTFKRALHDEIHARESTESKDIRLLVVGKTGKGKSTLINSIIELGKPVADEGAGSQIVTCSVQQYFYENIIPGVKVTVIDTPGLQDTHGREQSYIESMKSECQEVSLVLYCMKMTDHRLTNDDKLAMQKLHQAFGPKFWERVVFVLTFANQEDCEREDERDEPIDESLPNDSRDRKEEINRRFTRRVKVRASEIEAFLRMNIIDLEIVNEMLFVPAGDYKKTTTSPPLFELPGRKSWLYELLKSCCDRVKNVRFTKLSLNDKIHLAIVIDNDGTVTTDEYGQIATMNDQAAGIDKALKKLGFCVLYFNGLSSESIAWLLESLQHVDHSELASFALVILSKGKTYHVYDVNNEQVSFEVFLTDKKLADIPQLFFFHLSYPDKPKSKLAFGTGVNFPKNSIALAVSIKHPSDGSLSPAIRAFIDNFHSSKSIKQCFEEIQAAVHDSSDMENFLNEDYVLPSPNERQNSNLIFLKRMLHLCRTIWHRVRCETVRVILKSKDTVLDVLRKERITKITTSTASIVIGGTLVVAGIALIPFTFGGSIALSVAGGVVGAATGAGGIVAFITSKLMANREIKEAQQHICLDQQLSQTINKLVGEYDKILATKIQAPESKRSKIQAPESKRSKEAIIDGFQAAAFTGIRGAGIGVAVGLESAVEGVVVASRVAGRITGVVLAGISLAVTVPIDFGFIAYNSYLLHKSSKDESGKFDKDAVVRCFLKQAEEMLRGMFLDFGVVRHDIEEGSAIWFDNPECSVFDNPEYGCRVFDNPECGYRVFDNPECGYKVSVPANIKKTSISVRTIISGPFAVPEGATLVSAVYDVQMEEKLKASVTIEIEHCVDITDQSTAEKMTFATATVDSEKLLKFTALKDGSYKFLQKTPHGSISLSKSCLLCILYYSKSQQDQLMVKYAAQCSTTRECRNFLRKDISFTKCLSAHHKYIEMDAAPAVVVVTSYPFKFTRSSAGSPCIDLRDFKHSIRDNGWLISPDSTKVISDKIHKQEIDTAELQDFSKPQSSEIFPSLSLNIQVEDEERASDMLWHRINVIGTDIKVDITQQKEQ